MARRLLFGGTFDPIHLGHLHITREAQNQLNPIETHFIPCKIPVHKLAAKASAKARCDMIMLAIATLKNCSLSLCEIERKTPSYTLETLRYFKDLYPDDRLYWLIGSDSLNTFDSWYQPEMILACCNLAVIQRPGTTITAALNARYQIHRAPFMQDIDKNTGQVCLIETTTTDIASYRIREQFWEQPAIRQQVPISVQKYIAEHKLYK